MVPGVYGTTYKGSIYRGEGIPGVYLGVYQERVSLHLMKRVEEGLSAPF